jgi:WD40 repeat protein
MHPLVRLISPLAIVLLVLSAVALAADDKKEDKATPLVEKLGDDDVDVRKDATKKLLEMGEDAVPALLKAIKSHPDADVKLRAIILRQDIFKKLYGELRKFSGHTGDIRSIAVTSDGKKAITASMDYTMRLWDLETGKELQKFAGHTGWCWEVRIDKDDKEVLSSGALDKTMRLWDITNGNELKQYKGHDSRVYGADFAPDGKHVASSGAEKDTTIRIFDRKTGNEVKKLEGHTGWVWRIAYSPDGKKLASAGMNDNTFRIWDVEAGKTLITGDKAHEGYVVGVAWTPNGKQLLTAGRDLSVKLWDAETGKVVRTYTLSDNPEAIAFNKDGSRFMVGEGKLVTVYETATGKVAHRFEDHTEQVLAVAFTPDGRRGLSAGADKVLRMWGIPKQVK